MFPELPAPSSLLSSRWSRDNWITSHPARLYDGRVLKRIDLDSVESLVAEFAAQRGPFRTAAGRMGVFTWDIACEDGAGPFVLQLPLVLDEIGTRGRAKSAVPRANVENMRHFRTRGLKRFVVEPRSLALLSDSVPIATFETLPQHRSLSFGGGRLRVEQSEGRSSWLVCLGARTTAELLAEMIAALVYHYDADCDGGTAIADVAVNDGDFAVRRRADGSFELRLTAVRRRQAGISPELLLLSLIQLLAYEDWGVDDTLTGLPTSMSNPSVAFEGFVRGLRYRQRDLGDSETNGEREAKRLIETFAHSSLGRSYRPFAERFLEGRLPLAFGEPGGDLRERWWRVAPLEQRLGLLELEGRLAPTGQAPPRARALRKFLVQLSSEMGRFPESAGPELMHINELDRGELQKLLGEDAVEAFFSHWPYRSLNQLLERVPAAQALRNETSRLSFGHIVPDSEQGTLKSLTPAPVARQHELANAEVFGAQELPTVLHANAVRTFPSFEMYMDTALHDPAWGYYGRHVAIGESGHFDTHPESLSPHYGRWIATLAYQAFSELVARGELAEGETFSVVEFGAGNGRLARDFLDAVREAGASFGDFAARLRYLIYETSASLRAKQRALLGKDATISEGDARRPAETLTRDFPDGLKGFVVTNEVPDAFGVHKIALFADGQARVALVVPRTEARIRPLVSDALWQRIIACNQAVRAEFGFAANATEYYLAADVYAALMRELPTEARDALWFEEAYVPVENIPELARHLAANAEQYAVALAAEHSGVVLYVNLHAARFMRELGASLRAGLIVTIDYGDTTWGLVQGARRGDFPFRVYGAWRDYQPRANDPYAAPGTQDLTADVNFSNLAAAGQQAGLSLVHFGPERDIAGSALAEALSAARTQDRIADFLGSPVFKVLVMGTRTSDAFSTQLTTPLGLVRQTSQLAEPLRLKIARIQRTLAALDPG